MTRIPVQQQDIPYAYCCLRRRRRECCFTCYAAYKTTANPKGFTYIYIIFFFHKRHDTDVTPLDYKMFRDAAPLSGDADNACSDRVPGAIACLEKPLCTTVTAPILLG